MRARGKQTPLLFMVALLVFATIAQSFQANTSYAASQIINRKLTLKANGTNGGSAAGVASNHEYTFQLASTTSLGSIQFQYCTAAAGTCTAPPGLSTSGATIGSNTGGNTGFVNITSTAANNVYVARASASAGSTASTVIQLNGVTNPTASNTSFYVRINTFTSLNTTGTAIDTGNVAASTADPIVLTGTMPESLIFCTGGTVNANCTTTTSASITFSQLFSPTATSTANSQMAASTNAGTGYTITVNGATMTSGANSITAMTTAATAASTVGSSRFGMNLRANTTSTSTPAVGTDLTAASNGTDLKGQALTGYGTVDTFKFTSGDSVANSAYDGSTNLTLGPTNSQVYTATYIVNVSGIQQPGTYTTTLTYICTPTF
jgi:hypothetical protein